MSAGNFDCGKLLESKMKLEEIWQDSQAETEYMAEVEALSVIHSNQRGMELTELTSPDKDKQVKINWINGCDAGEVTEVTTQCEIGGAEVGDNCKDYALTRSAQIEWKVARKKYRTSIWSPEEVAARAMLSHMKKLDEYIVQDVVSMLDLMTGTNAFVPSVYTQSGGSTNIPASYWTPNLYGYLVQVAIKNKMRDAYMLSGNNLFQVDWNVKQQAGNAQNGQGDVNKMKSLQTYFDLFNIDSVLGSSKSFLIKPSAVAFVSKFYNKNSTPVPVGGNTGLSLYNQASKNLPFITYDIIHTVVCENDDFFDKWRAEVRYDLLLNPTNCAGTNTGVLSFKCA